METLSPEIREQLAELDTKAGALTELIEDEHSSIPEDPELQNLLDQLSELQNTITNIQEKQGWI
jgi:hypothetical protein